ncbi:hypothetical protein L2E82_11340 [Cichorium intybus]|uniref:Uncharacterized protein n=1 Tax=Cichorium intybus TaxID=13427 RepID=A0ACB9GCI8_CICIN|nr:hypothetical protein L2E82_11340 [Cichorium intybus]
MAEQRGGEVRNPKLGGCYEATDADDGVKKVDSSGSDGWGGLFSAEFFENMNSGCDACKPVDLSAGDFDVHGDVNSPENANDGSGADGETRFSPDGDVEISDFLESIFVDEYLHSDLNSENLKFRTNEVNGFCLGSAPTGIRLRSRRQGGGVDGSSFATAPKRIRMQSGVVRVYDRRDGLVTNEDSENQDFGRDTNRHDYFRVTAFDVHGDDNLAGIARDGGGGRGTRDRGVVVEPRLELERGSADVGTGGRISSPQVPGRIFASNGNESEVQRPEQERDNGGGRRRSHVVGDPRLGQESGIATARAGGDDETREVPVGIFANNGSNGGKAVVISLKQEGITVTVPVAVAVAVAVMLMVTVVLVSVMVW